MQLAGLTEWIAGLEASAARFANQTEGQITSALANFRDKRGELNYQLRKLQSNPPPAGAPQTILNDYRTLLASALETKGRADWLGTVADTFTNITGLGILPALVAGVPVAVMLAGVAALVIIISQITTATGRYMGARQIAAQAISEGKDATGALTTYYARNASTGLFGDAAQLVWPAAIVLGAFLLLGKR